MPFDAYNFSKRRRRMRYWGVFLFWGGLTALIIDVLTPFPTVVRGQFAAVEVLAMAFGAALWMLSRRLPTDEALEVAKMDAFQGSLDVQELAEELRVTLDTARSTLARLAEMGLARKEMVKDREVWRFPTVRLAPRLPGEPGPWRCSVCWADNRPDSLACSGCNAPRQQVEAKS